MNVLLWKDLRLNRSIFLATILLIALPYFIRPANARPGACWEISAFLSQFALALLGGNSIAGERADRSAEFLAFQGVTRSKVILSKGLICWFTYLCVNLTMLNLRAIVLPSNNLSPTNEAWMKSIEMGAAATGCVLCGSTWCLSSWLKGPVPAILIGSLTPFVVTALLKQLQGNLFQEAYWWYWYSAVCFAIGFSTFGGGCYLYLRNIEL